LAVSSERALLGAALPDATLADADGVLHPLRPLASGRPLLLAFVCNHCPYVRHIEQAFGVLASEFAAHGVVTVGVVSNDVVSYPDDDVDGMREQVERAGWDFPYLVDADQSLALAVGAVCTPDLFLYDAAGKLFFRGAFDDSTPRNGRPLTGAALRAALEAVVTGAPAPVEQVPALGCGIKWLEGNEPA
jgi:thiol-disulfide isomerase/thioredoxin